jgi:hypothetical protein
MSIGKNSEQVGLSLLGLSSVLRGQDPLRAILAGQETIREKNIKELEEDYDRQAKEYYKNLPEGSLKDFAKIMLQSPGGYKNLPAVFELQYRQEQERNKKDEYISLVDSGIREGILDERLGNQLKNTPVELGYKIYTSYIYGGPEEKTANQKDLNAWQKVKEDFDNKKISTEEYNVATQILGGGGAKRSKEQHLLDVQAKLLTSKGKNGCS